MKRQGLFAASFWLLVLSGGALACALPPSVVLTLPVGHYIMGAASAVGVTALLGAMAGRLPSFSAHLLWDRRRLLPTALTSYLSFLGLIALISIGFLGDRDPMHNMLTLVIWTVIWVIVPLGSVMFGNLWRAINPWTGPVRIARLLIRRRSRLGLAAWGHWPAVVGFFGFSWFGMVSVAPDDPAVLAQATLIYWVVIFVLAVLEGDTWLEQGEFLTVYFGYLAKIAPFWLVLSHKRARLMAGWPGTQVRDMNTLTPSAMAFISLTLAALTFDGLSESFWWLAMLGVNPLEFPGRTAVLGANTLGLLAVWAATAAAIMTALWAEAWLQKDAATGAVWQSASPVMLSFLAIAAGYHAAHYLVSLLTNGQFLLAALNDPFFQGDSILGLPPIYVSFGFLADFGMMTLIWNLQFVLILGAHVLAVVLALQLTPTPPATLAPPAGRHRRLIAYLPMTMLMVGYTVLGLWLLSTPRGA